MTDQPQAVARPFDAADHLVCRENLAFLRELPEACCDLIYVDPPFFTGRWQTDRGSARTFRDHWPGGMASYLEFLEPRLDEMRRCLKRTGTLYVHLDWRAVHHVRLLLDRLFGEEQFMNEIIWSYRTGGVSQQWFGRKHDNILVYARRMGEQSFNILREGVFRTDGMKRDAEGRPYKSTKNGPLYFHADGPALTDVWEIPFLSTVSSERCGYPTQKPLALLERIIRASTNKGDLVADFFCGSGTTLVAARNLERRYLGCDENEDAVELARKRLSALDAETPMLF